MSTHLALSLRFKLQTALLVWDAWVSVTSMLATLHQVHTRLLSLRSTERSPVTDAQLLFLQSRGDPLHTLARPCSDSRVCPCAASSSPREKLADISQTWRLRRGSWPTEMKVHQKRESGDSVSGIQIQHNLGCRSGCGGVWTLALGAPRSSVRVDFPTEARKV